MIGRLINNKASSFTMDEEADEKFIVRLLKSEDSIQKQMWKLMEPEQILQLFLMMLKDAQTPKVVEALKAKPEYISSFWDSLSKENRLRIWSNLDKNTKLALFIGTDEVPAYLKPD